jgi:cytochrome c-type biogenesis protein CcmH
MNLPNRGALAAGAALALLGGVVGWRLLDAGEEAVVAIDPAAPPTIESLVAAANADPADPQGWQRLGLALFAENRFAEAADAYARAVEADPGSAILWSALGEARVMASTRDPLPAAATAAFERALAIDPGDHRARYFMAVGKDLAGDHEGAIGDWLALLSDTPPGAPWEADLVRTIEQVGAINALEVTSRIARASEARNILPADALAGPAAQGRGPTAEEMAAASAIPPSQQQDMAEGMVARLAARLEREPDDMDGWIMLMRSYQQLGRPQDARAARARGIAANPAGRARIEQAGEALGID